MAVQRVNKKARFHRVALSFLLITAVFCNGGLPSVVFAATSAMPTRVELSAWVDYTVAGTKSSPENGQFIFRVDRQSGDINVRESLFVNSEGGHVGLGAYTFYEPGEYALSVQQVDQGKTGYTYDLSPVTVRVHVQEDNGALKASVSYEKNGVSVNEAIFYNSYIGNTIYEVSAYADKTVYAAGELITYTVVITNAGDLPVNGIYTRQYVPKGTTFEGVSGEGGAYGAISDKEHGTWFIPTLSKGESVALRLIVRVNACCPDTLCMKPLCDITGSTERIYTNDTHDPDMVVSSLVLQRVD